VSALDFLNPPQRAAVQHSEGALLVLAGAGSGKTRVIVEKIAYLISTGRYSARRIAAITFTNKAAREMRQRVSQRLRGEVANDLTLCTFHALGLKFLQVEYAHAGLKRGFSVFDADEAANQIKELAGLASNKDEVATLINYISHNKNAGLSPTHALAYAKTAREKNAALVYERYQARLRAFNAVDFDDLIALPVHVLESNPHITHTWQQYIGYLLVDECQDSNDAQYRLLKCLAGPLGNFTCVGDDDQSIYAWRGANPQNLQQMQQDYPALRIIKLEQNYRCTERVLRAANALIAHNPHDHLKTLWSDQGEGTRIRLWECRDRDHEAEKVAAEIHYQATARRLPWRDFCILFRGNFQSRPLEKALQLLNIPYHLSGGTAFLERTEVKDALAWLRLLVNPADDSAFLRAVQAPRRDIGAATLAKLAQLAAEQGLSLAQASTSVGALAQLPARAASNLARFAEVLHQLRSLMQHISSGDLIRQLVQRSGLLAELRQQASKSEVYQRRAHNLEELAQWFEERNQRASAADLAAHLALLTHADEDDSGNQVHLMTLHAAKGLEFPCVFIVGCDEGTLPHESGEIEEERRLLYVGMTRAKQQLWLSYSKFARTYGQVRFLKPSRFLAELPAVELHRDGDNPALDNQHKAERRQAALATIFAELASTPKH